MKKLPIPNASDSAQAETLRKLQEAGKREDTKEKLADHNTGVFSGYRARMKKMKEEDYDDHF